MKLHFQISTVLHTPTHASGTQCAFAASLCSFALIFSSAFCSAQTCGANVEAANPVEQILANEFQPSHYDPGDGTRLQHVRYAPAGAGPWPAAVTIPPNLFRVEIGDMGTHAQRVAAKDLTDNGFLVFQVEHRLAPPGLLYGQTRHDDPVEGVASGRPPQQTDDIKQQILAALDDPDCNGKVFLLGGSSGGSHALWVALDSASGNVTGWDPTKIKAVVSFSGVTDLGSREHDPDLDLTDFIFTVENYTNTHLMLEWYYLQEAASPITLVANATYIPPIRLYATEHDTVPWQQARNMKDALFARGADVVEYTMNGSEHCFNQWQIVNSVTQQCVRDEVIAFLNLHKYDP